jgi:hypothetical protein
MGVTVATKCLSEHMTALEDFSYQLVTISLRLIAEVLGLGLLPGSYIEMFMLPTSPHVTKTLNPFKSVE